ncbi:NACHT domain-containing protein [Roseateles sp. P5_D6]
MAEKKETSATAFDVALKVFDTLWNWAGATDTWRWLMMGATAIICVAIAIYVATKALTKFAEALSKLLEVYKSSGLPLFLNPEDKVRVRRRKQFCAVLEADLAYIAKAESWNDQYFTDLEAEVETEGGYYISPFHRMISKRSQGLRKETSLIKAISSSSERAIQLTGEPGAGKSVALRHLAAELAARGKRSNDKKAIVPLYVNLRELEFQEGQRIDANAIRDFVLDNVRRGDSDTSDFVRKNWDDYRERGIWYFLFDSFDEIPAVLHAKSGDPTTKAFSEAIRQFLDGMGDCKGILASREFKGPEALPWKKFRILSLNWEKQEELVANAFLTSEQATMVLHHLTSTSVALTRTPLFLTLLCRYVKEENKAPSNDFQLLALHIQRLAGKDRQYLSKQYGLTPAQLLQGSQRVARLFAEEPTIGLSPTVDQVAAYLPAEQVPGRDISKFVSAMVDFKIARADVPNATPGDRRFAFSHRRYQEALFVQYLVENPSLIQGRDLLVDSRWREYSVTLLETQEVGVLEGMFAAALDLLRAANALDSENQALPPASDSGAYFTWGTETTALLKLLHDGLARRADIIPDELIEAVETFLSRRWDRGDSIDRINILALGGLLPSDLLSRYLSESFKSGTRRAQSQAFAQVTLLRGSINRIVRDAVLQRLADGVVSAKGRADIFRLEALAARLPFELGAEHVFRRSLVLWKFSCAFKWLVEIFIFPLRSLLWLKYRLRPSIRLKGAPDVGLTIFIVGFCLYISAAFALESLLGGGSSQLDRVSMSNWDLSLFRDWALNSSTANKVTVLLILMLCVLYLMIPAVYSLRAEPQRIRLSFIRKLLNAQMMTEVIVGLILLAIVGGVLWGVGVGVKYLMALLFGVSIGRHAILVGGMIGFALSAFFVIIDRERDRRKERQAGDSFAVMLDKNGGDEYLTWLACPKAAWLARWIILSTGYSRAKELGVDKMAVKVAELRSLSAILQREIRSPSDRLTGAVDSRITRGEALAVLNLIEWDYGELAGQLHVAISETSI